LAIAKQASRESIFQYGIRGPAEPMEHIARSAGSAELRKLKPKWAASLPITSERMPKKKTRST